jgi:hypothetical protein
VSAILEALKKLEQETSEPSGHPLRRETEHHGKWRKAFLPGMLAAGVILCGLAGTGVVVLTRKTPVTPEFAIDGNITAPSRPVPASTKPAPEPAASVQPVMNPVAAPRTYQTTAPVKAEESRNAQETPSPAREIVAVALEQEPLPGQTAEEAIFAYGSNRLHGTAEELPAETAEEAMPPLDSRPPALPEAESTSARPEPDRVSNAASGVIKDSEVVLQAISWSRDALRRMAVINGKICRESEQINGYVVLKINPEDVVVSKGSVSGRLVFKIR